MSASRTAVHGLLRKIADSPPGERLTSMEGLRGLSILLVFWCHYQNRIGTLFEVPKGFAQSTAVMGRTGTIGVDIFFVISGFLIYRSVLRTDTSIWTFLKRRAKRIYPAFLGLLGVYLVLSTVSTGFSRIPSDPRAAIAFIVENCLLLPGFVNVQPIIGVAWSLSYEWYFYITIALAAKVLRLSRWQPRSRIFLFSTLAILYVLVSYAIPDLSFFNAAQISRTHVRLTMFLAGMILSDCLMLPEAHAAFTKRRETLAIVLAVAGFSLLLALEANYPAYAAHPELMPRFDALRTLILALSLTPLIAWTLAGNHRLARLFNCFELRWLGNVSYSFYLAHMLGVNAVRILIIRLADIQTLAVLSFFIFLPVTLFVALLISISTFLAFEKRFSAGRRKGAEIAGVAQEPVNPSPCVPAPTEGQFDFAR